MPLHMSDNDAANENVFAELIARRYHPCSLEYNGRKYPIDWMMYVDGMEIWSELKCRWNPVGRYKTLNISARKIVEGLNYAQWTNRPFSLFVRWDDMCGVALIEHADFPIEHGGRRDRGDPNDVEPMICIPTGIFEPVDIDPSLMQRVGTQATERKP